MARTLLMFRLPGFEFGPAFVGLRLKSMIAMGFACGVAAGLVHGRLLGLL